jgi:hypothetical protein
MKLRYVFCLLALYASAMSPCVTSCFSQDETGTVILHATDIDSGQPIANVNFAIQNSLAEMWAETVGKSNDAGTLQLESKPQPGYFYLVHPVPAGYKVVGLDDVPSDIKPGLTTLHRFHLRKLDTKVNVPAIVPRPDNAEQKLPPKAKDGAQETSEMPGFLGERVRLHFSDAQIAEDIFRNGSRIRAAIEDELLQFQKSEGKKAGNIRKIRDVKIIRYANEDHWYVFCRTEGAMKLRQDGFRIAFNSTFDRWDLEVPDYLHPDF